MHRCCSLLKAPMPTFKLWESIKMLYRALLHVYKLSPPKIGLLVHKNLHWWMVFRIFANQSSRHWRICRYLSQFQCHQILLTVSASKLRIPSSSVAPSFIISCPSSTRVQPLVCSSGTTSRALIFNWASFIHHDYERKGAKYQITTESEEDFPDYIYSLPW